MSQLGTLGPVSEVYVNGSAATLKAATAGKKWRLLGGVLSAGGGESTITIQSGGGDDAVPLVGPLVLAAKGNLVLNTSDIGYGTGQAGWKLAIEMSAAVYGTLIVQLVDE